MTMIIDGRKIADQIQEAMREEVELLKKSRPPCLAVILVGDNPASHTYVRMKRKNCAKVGITSHLIELPYSATEQQVLMQITQLNQDEGVDGILVQLPLPPHIDTNHIVEAISPYKDVDGLHPMNLGKLLAGGDDGFIPCTPKGVAVLLKTSKIEVAKKHVVIVGRSNIVGKPLSVLFMQKSELGNATVTIAHSYSTDLDSICKAADILVAAIGQPYFIQPQMVRPGAVVIDVGINRVIDESQKSQYKLVGDVDFEKVAPLCSAITAVPGGVGPMTIAMLLSNTFLSYKRKFKVSV